MASLMGSISAALGKNLLPKMPAKPILLVNRPFQFKKAEFSTLPQLIHKKTVLIDRKPLKLFVVQSSNSDIDTGSTSPAHTIMRFYSAINEKKTRQLADFIAEDCLFEDYSFPIPFQGRKETMHFLEQLTSCMGRNMQFNVEDICEGNDYTAAVSWHLDWNTIQVPFTRGCSYFSLSFDGDKLVINKARILIESPIKLGGAALTIFKIMTSLFDAFPAATEWFLKSPHVIFQLLLKAYKIVIQPILSPFLGWYIKLFNVVTCIISFSLNIVYYLAKIFNM